ncbi:MAG: helix-turn-helix domain-containing protein [bacterium]
MTVAFRNVDASPSDPVATWPYEGLVICIERGLVADWRPVIAELRCDPWGWTARRVESYLGYAEPSATTRLFALVIERARAVAEAGERAEVAARVRAAIAASGMTAAAFADAIGTSPSRLSTYASGRVVPSAALLVRMERRAVGT